MKSYNTGDVCHLDANNLVKILHCIRQGSFGGGESHVFDLVSNLDGSTYKSVVLTFSEGILITRLKDAGIRVYVIPSRFPFDVTTWKSVKKIIRNESIDIIHAHGTRTISNVYHPGRALSVPVIYTVHGWSIHENESTIKKYLAITAERFLKRQTAATINVSFANQETGKKYIPNFHSTIIPYGIDLNKFNDAAEFRDIRNELGIPGHTTVVGYLARITEQKDPFTMVRAFHRVLQRDEDIVLLMVGDGNLKDQTMSLTRELCIEQHVRFLDFTTNVPAMLHNIDIYCLPSLWEGLPIGLLEAMAMKKAIIATAVDGTKEVIEDRQNGMLINPGDYEALADAISALHKARPFRKILGENAFATVHQNYGIAKMIQSTESLYQKVLEPVITQSMTEKEMQEFALANQVPGNVSQRDKLHNY